MSQVIKPQLQTEKKGHWQVLQPITKEILREHDFQMDTLLDEKGPMEFVWHNKLACEGRTTNLFGQQKSYPD